MKKKIEVTAFSTDQKGIDKLKSKYFEKCEEFIYFRKGEWTGIHKSVTFAYDWISNHQDIIFLWVSNSVNVLAALEYSRRMLNWFDEKVLNNIRKKYSK